MGSIIYPLLSLHLINLSAEMFPFLAHVLEPSLYLFIYFFNFNFYFILLYNTVLVLPYIDMNPPWVYMPPQIWTLLPPPSPQHPSGSSPCTSPRHAVSWNLLFKIKLMSVFVKMWTIFPVTAAFPPRIPSLLRIGVIFTSQQFLNVP